MSKPKEYIFSNTFTVTEETEVLANSYDEAVEIFLSGGGVTDEVYHSGGDWECIQEPDDTDIEGYEMPYTGGDSALSPDDLQEGA
jgi:hypothetical protein